MSVRPPDKVARCVPNENVIAGDEVLYVDTAGLIVKHVSGPGVQFPG